MSDIEAVLGAIDQDLEASIARWLDLLRIPSVSTDPANKPDCRRAAQWLVDELTGLGFESQLHDTAGHPMVTAHADAGAAARAPRVLFYGHYDVQPADPLDKWTSPPFEPVRRKDSDGVERIYARGAADDKGQLLTFVEAARAWVKINGRLPVEVTMLFEGEEECGSPNLVPFLEAHREMLSNDVALVCDTNMWDASTPAITTRLRGLVHDEVTIVGPSIDLHSGHYGGAAWNPIRILAHVLADVHDEEGRVTIPGFYDGVEDLPQQIAEQWAKLDFSERDFLGEIGLEEPAGESGRSVLEQIWARPTAEFNGIYGGYTGPGTKTVIPSRASAKITFRLVGTQDPAKIRDGFRVFVETRLPKGITVEFSKAGGGSPAIEVAEDSDYLARAAQALAAEFGRPTVLMGAGGSIPVVRSFKDLLGMDSLLVGFSLNDDAIHSPNEKYNLSSFHHGIRSWARILDSLAS
jgi:acetylornithine deacetylase/succinyl-diaminopimelate desuccinylase-like protein